MRHRRPHCSHCMYWVPEVTSKPATVGHCHRFPPDVMISPTSGTIVQKFPTTDHQHWCGEWSDDDARLVEGARRVLAQTV